MENIWSRKKDAMESLIESSLREISNNDKGGSNQASHKLCMTKRDDQAVKFLHLTGIRSLYCVQSFLFIYSYKYKYIMARSFLFSLFMTRLESIFVYF